MKLKQPIFQAGALLLASALMTAPVLAQKSKDTLRVGVYQPISIVDGVFDPHPQTNMMDRMVFNSLLTYDTDNRKYLPGLAVSWKRIDSTTMEFKLRQGIKFHDGSEFDADDVVYTFNFVTDPNVKFRFKGHVLWPSRQGEKIDKFTVRIKTKTPYAAIESRLSDVRRFFLPTITASWKRRISSAASRSAPVHTKPSRSMRARALFWLRTPITSTAMPASLRPR